MEERALDTKQIDKGYRRARVATGQREGENETTKAQVAVEGERRAWRGKLGLIASTRLLKLLAVSLSRCRVRMGSLREDYW